MTPATKREHLYQLVAGKKQSFRPLTAEEKRLGFLGWHQRGYLPHCDYPGLIQFITFRLADSMPASRKGEWEHLLKIEDDREKRTKLEAYLDRGIGQCHLRNPQIAKIAEDSLLHFQQERYDMMAWCIMPNHVHVLVHIWDTPMWKLLQSWKRFIATRLTMERRIPIRPPLERRIPIRPPLERRIPIRHAPSPTAPNQKPALQKRTPFWEREYWDTYMRDTDQQKKAIRYIENNPTKSKFCRLPADWPYSSAKFRDPYQSLSIPAPGPPNSDSAPIGTPNSDSAPLGPPNSDSAPL